MIATFFVSKMLGIRMSYSFLLFCMYIHFSSFDANTKQFGSDACDLPLDDFVQTINTGVKSFLQLKRSGREDEEEKQAEEKSDDKRA